MRILIVEDEVKIRTGMSKLISEHTEHTVVGEARNGKEGLELIRSLRPELVISDIRMPVMGGLEMLEEVKRLGIRCHFIVLSGYSEFEYAQKALRYGVDDYLLKPLAPEDVTSLLDRIQDRISEETQLSAQSTEGLLRELILGIRTGTQRDYETLRKEAALSETEPCFLAAGCLRDVGTAYFDAIEERLARMKELYPEYTFLCTTLENTREVFCLIQGQTTEEELCMLLQRRLYRGMSAEDMPVWTMQKLESPQKLGEAGATLRDRYIYGMVFGYHSLITEEMIESFKEKPYQYPAQLEGRIRASLCQGAEQNLQKDAEAFMDCVRRMGCNPRDCRKAYEKLLACIENVCGEVNPEAARQIQNRDLAKAVSEAVTIGALERCLQKAVEIVLASKDRREDIRNYTIRRAINFIREHYMENISLELLADHLEITPEYLSTLFNKEMGLNFTTFLKQFRISHAKRLLKGSDKKIYEIANEVGYNDPKYFNRVFKEEVGLSPGDYRQTK